MTKNEFLDKLCDLVNHSGEDDFKNVLAETNYDGDTNKLSIMTGGFSGTQMWAITAEGSFYEVDLSARK